MHLLYKNDLSSEPSSLGPNLALKSTVFCSIQLAEKDELIFSRLKSLTPSVLLPPQELAEKGGVRSPCTPHNQDRSSHLPIYTGQKAH